jgi:hypothetical protein
VPLLLSTDIRVIVTAYRTNRQKMKIGVSLIIL